MPAFIPEHFQKSTWWRNTSRNAAFSPNTPTHNCTNSINHYHSRMRWLHDQLWQERLGVKRSLNVVCWRQIKFESLIRIQAKGEIVGGILARGLTYKDRDSSWDTNSHWLIVFFSDSLPKLQSTSYPEQYISDVTTFDASDGYANTQTVHSEWRYFVPHVTEWNRFLPKS